MKNVQLGIFIVAQSLLVCSPVLAAAQPYQWSGYYFGATAGGNAAHFDMNTSTNVGIVNASGNQSINTKGFFSGIEAGYNQQVNRLLLGFETDIQSLSINGETNTGAVFYPNSGGNQFVLTSYANNNWLFTARPRIGWVNNNWLFYVTGGLALAQVQSDFLFTNSFDAIESTRVSQIVPGYVMGAGVEAGLTNHLSVKAEYLFASFKEQGASYMNNNAYGQTFSNSVKMRSNTLKIGINYHLDAQPGDAQNSLLQIPTVFDASAWDTELGARLFASSGITGAPQPLLNTEGMPLASRLTFSNLSAFSGEIFGRADHVSRLFLKGYLGAGTVTNGQLNDEDFPALIAYSNTLSNALGNLSYATTDLGYTWLKAPTGNVGGFIGYNYYAQHLNIYNCSQVADGGVCAGAAGVPLDNFLVLSEDDKFNSLRIGFSTQFDLVNRFTLTSEAAYLPVVNFKGIDMHNVRELYGPEQSGLGDGAMIEAVLDYQLSDMWDVGLGGRYWMWNMHNGSVLFDFLGESPDISEPARFNMARYGLFLQVSYRHRQTQPANEWHDPFDWQGVYVGGHMGGAWGQSEWTDPFGSTAAGAGFVNVAGFGDNIRSTGPLGGMNFNINWQKNLLVYGVGASFSAADVRGENTLYSGLGGVNGQTIINYLGTLVARIGVADDRSLLYVNVGRAVLNTQYNLNGNTGVLLLGSQSETQSNWGWTSGIGVEHALTDHWTTSVEYDYVYIPYHTVSFPSVAILNTQQLTANQAMNLFKVGLNYKF